MTLIVDANEHRNHPDLVPLLQTAGLVVDVGNTNQSPGDTWGYPDFLIWESMTGINRKTVGEWLSSSDKVIEQVQRELAGPINHLVLLLEGVMVPQAGGGMWAYSIDWINARPFQSMQAINPHGTVQYERRPYSVNYKHVQNEQTRLEFLGVQVVHTYDLHDSIAKIAAFHDLMLSGKPNNVLNKLYKPDIHVLGLTPQETAFAKTLMGVQGANWGEELALTVAALGFRTIGELFTYWNDGSTLADTLLREKQGVRTRRIGDAAERRLQSALGYTVVRQAEGAAVGSLPPA